MKKSAVFNDYFFFMEFLFRALEKVILEENEEKEKNHEIKRKRKEILELRKEKLRKLNDVKI